MIQIKHGKRTRVELKMENERENEKMRINEALFYSNLISIVIKDKVCK